MPWCTRTIGTDIAVLDLAAKLCVGGLRREGYGGMHVILV
jgi:hypothetical protein